jgi:hypothetical protein
MLHSFRTWLAHKPKPRTAIARPRLGCEMLEDRTIPSVGFGSAMAASPPPDNPLGSSTGNAIAVDQTGNTYVTGRFAGTVDFDPANEVSGDTLTAATVTDSSGQVSNKTNGFVAKYNADGSLAWVRAFGNADDMGDIGSGIAVDGAGNVLVAGSFSGTVDFGGIGRTANGQSDGFVAKLDPDGNFGWVNRVGGAYRDSLAGIAVDGDGNVYATGESWKTDSFTDTDIDAIVLKWNAAGSLAWSHEVGGGASDRGAGIAVDGSGNVFVTGEFRGTVDFDPGSGTFNLSSGGNKSSPSTAAYVLKLNTDGGFGWARHFQADSSSSSAGRAIAVDGSGNVYTTGVFHGTVDFNPATGRKDVFKLTGQSQDVYAVKLTPAGGFAWAKQVGGSGSDNVTGLTVDGAGAIYLAGTFSGTADFDPGSGSYLMTASGNYDAFVMKLDTAGNFNWAVQTAGPSIESAQGLAVDSAGNVRVTGGFSGTVDFDPGPGEYLLSSAYTSMYIWTLPQN